MKISDYLSKMKGGGKSPPGVGLLEMLWALIGSVVGIGICGRLSADYFEPRDLTLIIGSLGASAILVYGAVRSPFSQPRSLIGGHIVSGLVGVACYQFFGGTLWLASGLAVAFAMIAMMATKTLHPPGGATALIYVIGGPKLHALGFLYAFVPAGLGAFILVVVAVLINNLSQNRRYPEYWL
ncbi:MAG: HPP family protein [Deltaproteobacteria bacterium]|nr:HPP family protein [Deltaproteobacteria bacterium]